MKNSLREKSADSSAPVLLLEGVAKSYAKNGSVLKVLENVSLSAGAGEFVCITGPSGCGKTTLLRIIAGFEPLSSGRVLVNGREARAPGSDRAVVFQEDALFPWLTVEENTAFGLRAMGFSRKKARERVFEFLSLVGLSDFAAFLPREISGGMRQRVALARVLVMEPSIILMDEPFAALDFHTRREMGSLLISLREKLDRAIIFVTHDVSEAVTLSDRVAVMSGLPGSIFWETPIRLSRPRNAESPEFAALCGLLLERMSKGPTTPT